MSAPECAPGPTTTPVSLVPPPTRSARFPLPQEAAYQASLDQGRRGATRITAAFGLLLHGAATLVALEAGAAERPDRLLLFGLVPAVFLMAVAWASWRPFFSRVYQPMTVTMVLLLAAVALFGTAGHQDTLDALLPRTAEVVLILMTLHGLTFLDLGVVCGTSAGIVGLALAAHLLGGRLVAGPMPATDSSPSAVTALLILVTACVLGCVISVGRDRHLRDLFRSMQDLEQEKRRAEVAAQARGEFLAAMSHEIRTPLNAVLGLTHIALEGGPAEPLRARLLSIADASRHLAGLVDNVLDFSKIDAGRLTLERTPIELGPLLVGAAAMLRERAQAKGIELVLDLHPQVPRVVQTDPLRLRQILVNLCSNAVKFTSVGRVDVRVFPEPGSDQERRLVIEVRDTGVGMSPQVQAHLFESFWQADSSTTRRFGGTGLGLAITHRLVTLFGGTISVESVVGSGSTFRVDLPLEEAPGPGPVEPVAPAPVAPLCARILVVEDDPFSQIVACELLVQAGFTVDLAPDGPTALRMAARERYAAVLMDLRLPGMDGIEATQELRRSWPRGTLPIIAMTAATLASDRDACLAAGMDAFVAKPIEPEALWEILGRWFPTAEAPAADGDLPPTPALARVPGLDAQAGLARVQGNERLYLDLLRRLVHTQREAGQILLSLLEAGERDAAARQAHTLKGLLATLGAHDLSGQAAGIEALILTDAPTPCLTGEGLRFSADMESLLAALREALPPLDTQAPVWAEPARLEEVCARLRGLLAQDDTEATRLLEAEEALLSAALPGEFPALREAVLSYDYDRARDILARANGRP